MAFNPLSLPAYTDNSMSGSSLFNPMNSLSQLPIDQQGNYITPDQSNIPTPDMISKQQTNLLDTQPWLGDKGFNIQNYMPQGETKGDQWIRDAYAQYQASQANTASTQSPQMVNGLSQVPVGAEYNTQSSAMVTPQQQLNAPSLTDIAQTQPFAPPPQIPMATQPPQTQAVVQQIQAPVTGAPNTSVPVTNAPPQTQQLISQIKAPTAPRPNPFVRAPIPQIQSQPIARSLIQPRAVVPSRPVSQSRPVVAKPMARSVSRINPPLLPSRPMGRR